MLGKLKNFIKIVYTTKNWISTLSIRAGLKRECLVIFRKGHRLKINKKEWPKFLNYVNFFKTFPNGKVDDGSLRIRYAGQELVFYFGKWGPNIVSEIFGADVYMKALGKFNISGRDVVDVGAYIGDSAIFFGVLGARKVYGFEPFSPFYNLAVKNIKANKMDDVCEIVKSAVGAQGGSLLIDPAYDKMLGIWTKDFKTGEEVPITTLKDIVDDYAIDKGVLKLDSEGYEYETILNTGDEILRHFDYIIIEYHYGFEKLKRKLEKAGFRVDCTKPLFKFIQDKKSKYGDIRIGYLTAEKI